ncbi:CRISPR-associated protein Cas2 [Paenibacillus barengoltzii]|uniref:CRISPR-associated protein Cas2 n=1 Tax=Paenibacillus barengoltzii TaxID=343517 RepID=UPI000FDAAA05|nr:CRISPR-associated protein Cas2 [Paenibacillus barengoltzii]
MNDKSYLISYDLIAPGRNYDKLFEAIKAYPKWAKLLESVWVIKSSRSAAEVRDNLQNYIDKNDKLIVMNLSREAAWYNLPDTVTKWLQENL